MFGTKPRISSLRWRKEILIAESEINRVHLAREWRTPADELCLFAHHAQSFKNMASSMMSLVAVLVAFTNHKPAPAAPATSWLEKAAGAARLASSLWLAFRTGHSNSEGK